MNPGVIPVGRGPPHQVGRGQRAFDYREKRHAAGNILKEELGPVGRLGSGCFFVRAGGRDGDGLQVAGHGRARLRSAGVLTKRAVDAHAAGQQDNLPILVGLRLQALHEHQRPGAPLLLKDVQDAKLPGNPFPDVGRTEELPVAPAVEAIAVERERHLEMRFLPRPKVADGRRDVLPGGERRTNQAPEPAGLGGVPVDVERIRVFGGVGQVVDHLLADGEAVPFWRRLQPDQGADLLSYQAVGQPVPPRMLLTTEGAQNT